MSRPRLSGIEKFLRSLSEVPLGELLRRASAIAISAPRESSLGERIAEFVLTDSWYSYIVELDNTMYQVVVSKYDNMVEIMIKEVF